MPADAPDNSFELEDDLPDPTPAKRTDAAQIAATIMLDRALADAGISATEVAAEAVISVVLVADLSWSAIVRADWRHRMRGGEAPTEGYQNYGRTKWAC